MQEHATKNKHTLLVAHQRERAVWRWKKGSSGVTSACGEFVDEEAFAYISFKTPAVFEEYEKYLPVRLKTFYEVTGDKTDFIVDVEWVSKAPERETIGGRVVDALVNFWPTATLGASLSRSHVIVQDGSRALTDGHKNSFHLVVKNGQYPRSCRDEAVWSAVQGQVADRPSL